LESFQISSGISKTFNGSTSMQNINKDQFSNNMSMTIDQSHLVHNESLHNLEYSISKMKMSMFVNHPSESTIKGIEEFNAN
jgi:hypothetical protein